MAEITDIMICATHTDGRMRDWYWADCDDCGVRIVVPSSAAEVPRKVCGDCAMEISPDIASALKELAARYKARRSRQ